MKNNPMKLALQNGRIRQWAIRSHVNKSLRIVTSANSDPSMSIVRDL